MHAAKQSPESMARLSVLHSQADIMLRSCIRSQACLALSIYSEQDIGYSFIAYTAGRAAYIRRVQLVQQAIMHALLATDTAGSSFVGSFMSYWIRKQLSGSWLFWTIDETKPIVSQSVYHNSVADAHT